MSKLAHLIAKEEGYDIPGSVPNRNNNPGDLRHSPHSFHTPEAPNAIGRIDTPEHGWADLEEQLEKYAKRGLTLQQAIEEFAPPSENNTAAYLAYVCNGLNLPRTTLVSEALKVPQEPMAVQPITGWTPTGSTAAASLATGVATVLAGTADWLWPAHPMPMSLAIGLGGLIATAISFFHPDGGRR